MPKFTGSLVKYPARVSVAWYLGLMLVGGLTLTHPYCRVPEKPPISFIDAIFTATSAVCVTGLSVRSTGNDFSFAGQAVIALLVQLGGIGIMTVTTFVTYRMGGRSTVRDRMVLAETLGAHAEADLARLLRNVIGLTLVIEGVGFVLLTARNLYDMSLGDAMWHALFHAVAAFCNAGFGLFDDSLTRYQSDIVVNLTVMALIVTGGIGFPVMLDLGRNWHGPWTSRWDRLHVHSKTMLIGTMGLLVIGTVGFLVLEWDKTLRNMPMGTRLLVAMFQSTTPRTAGFNTCDIAGLSNATLFMILLLMMIGAGPCSTGGGFKVSTLMALVYRAWSTIRGFRLVNVFRRTIPEASFQRANAAAMLFIVVATVGLTILLVVQDAQFTNSQSHRSFLDVMFEVVSALGTVGLSTGVTPNLTWLGKIVVIVLMFIGRLGPISVFIALSRSERSYQVEFPQEEPMIG